MSTNILDQVPLLLFSKKKVPLLLIKECLTSLSLVSSSIPFPFFCFLILSSSCYCIMDGLHCLPNSSNGFPIFRFSSHSWLWILEKKNKATLCDQWIKSRPEPNRSAKFGKKILDPITCWQATFICASNYH